MIVRSLILKDQLAADGLISGAGTSALMALAAVATVVSKPREVILTSKPPDTIGRTDRLSVPRHSFVRRHQYNGTMGQPWQFAGGETVGEKGRYPLPSGTRFLVPAEPPQPRTPVLVLPIKSDIPVDQWYARINDLKYCRAFVALPGPVAGRAQDVSVLGQ